MRVHPTAVIEGNVIIGEDVEIGPYVVVRGNVIIGNASKIGSHTIIEGNVEIGERNLIGPYAYIGGLPQDLSYKGERSFIKIGNGNVIREFVTIHTASGEGNCTKVGDSNYLMAYVHLAHNVEVGNNCIIVNAAQLAGYVKVDDHAFISGLVGVHQFARIGGYSIVGGGVRVSQDVLPFMMIAGEPPKVYGLNIVGLKRKGFSRERIAILKEAFDILCRRGLSLPSAIETIRNELPMNEDIKYLLDFIANSKRGVLRRPGYEAKED
uniref:Acyl-ACP--UDP-N-acetylglucosamine O-acyltransferase n=2 Tax=candidate division WOR-3 bacterium TaxID=2052148 RepID=A0A7V3ZW50_UNCW3